MNREDVASWRGVMSKPAACTPVVTHSAGSDRLDLHTCKRGLEDAQSARGDDERARLERGGQ